MVSSVLAHNLINNIYKNYSNIIMMDAFAGTTDFENNNISTKIRQDFANRGRGFLVIFTSFTLQHTS